MPSASRTKLRLPSQFWDDEAWKSIFRQQVAAANKLMKLLDPAHTGSGEETILEILRSETGRTVHSLAASWVKAKIFALHAQKVQAEMKTIAHSLR